MALFLPVLQQYEASVKPNAFLEQLPNDYQEAGALVKRRAARK
jgi:hypothetical protein